MPRKQAPSNLNTKPKKKKGHHPAHQNTFAYRHNPKSKRTDKILASPNVGLCRRCHDKIEWRKKYRKYKPLTQHATCNLCRKRNISAAYHTICDGCASSDLAYEKMMLVMAAEGGKSVSNEKNDSSCGESLTQEGTTTINVPSSHTSSSVLSSIESTAVATAKRSCTKVCAMCVKEAALQGDDHKSDKDTEIKQQIDAMELKLKRPLKLRETKAIERKVQRAHEREKERLKEERRKAREEEKEAEKRGGLDQSNNGGSRKGNEEVLLDEESDDGSVDNNMNQEIDDDDDDDPFLTAIGGREKLLTGDAYRKRMILEGEKQLSKMQLSS